MERRERPAVVSRAPRAPRLERIRRLVTFRLQQAPKGAVAALRQDLGRDRHSLYATLVGTVTVLATVAYYRSGPQIEIDPDTPAFLSAARHIATQGVLVDPARVPGYPLLICAVFGVAGQGNQAALSIVQAGLFVVATLEVYALLFLLLPRSWAAAGGAALVGTNSTLLSYVKPILSEALTLFLVVNLALAVTLFLRQMRTRTFWIVVGWSFALFMTRPEWMFLPPLLFACLLGLAHQRRRFRPLLPHALAALAVVYAVLGLYVAGNAARNHLAGVTFVSNINLLGKVMQYRMQDEAPPQYAAVTRIVDSYLARGDADPWHVTGQHESLKRNWFELAAQYSEAIILRHPIQYLADSVPVMWTSLEANQPYRPLPPSGALPALWGSVSGYVLRGLVGFPIVACVWWALLVAKRRTKPVLKPLMQVVDIEPMAMVALLAAYALAVTTLSTYSMYERLHTPFDPLLIVVIWAALVAAGVSWFQRDRSSGAGSLVWFPPA